MSSPLTNNNLLYHLFQSAPNLTGPNILHTHSIKSWLEQQDFNNRLPSPTEGMANNFFYKFLHEKNIFLSPILLIGNDIFRVNIFLNINLLSVVALNATINKLSEAIKYYLRMFHITWWWYTAQRFIYFNLIGVIYCKMIVKNHTARRKKCNLSWFY